MLAKRLKSIFMKARRAPLTALLCGCLCAYYVAAWRSGGLPDVRNWWNTEEVQIRWPGRRPISLWLWNSNQSDLSLGPFLQFNRTWIGILGNVLNYHLGVTPEWMTIGARTPVTWYFWSLDLPSQESSAVGMIRRQYVPGEREFPALLRKEGVTCITLPVPVKSEIERPYVPVSWKARYDYGAEAYREIVSADPTWTVDLYSAYTSYLKSHPEAVLYRPLDIHWDSLGMAIAAREIITLLARNGWKVRVPGIRQTGVIPEANSRLANFFFSHLFLPPFFVDSHPELHWTEQLYGIDRMAPPGKGRVVIFGTSFSSPTGQTPGGDYSYGSLVARALGRKLVVFSLSGMDFIDVMRSAVNQGFTLHRGDIVILEFPLWQIEWIWKKSRVFPKVEG